MSIDAVDVVVADRVESAIGGVVFPPADGEFVRVDTGTEWLRGWVVVDPSQKPTPPENWAAVAVMPVSADAAVWEGRVTPDQVSLEAPGVQPVWWSRVAPLIVETMTARRDAGAARVAQRTAEDGKAELASTHTRWIDALVESAHEWADDNSLCSQFDNFMESHDLPGRSRMYDVEVEVNIRTTVTVSVSARSGDNAADSVDTSEVESAVRDKYGIAGYVDVDIDDWTVENTEEA